MVPTYGTTFFNLLHVVRRGHDDAIVDERGAAHEVIHAVPLLEHGAHVRPLAELRRGVLRQRDSHPDAVDIVSSTARSERGERKGLYFD